jgi:hypothetical protein
VVAVNTGACTSTHCKYKQSSEWPTAFATNTGSAGIAGSAGLLLRNPHDPSGRTTPNHMPGELASTTMATSILLRVYNIYGIARTRTRSFRALVNVICWPATTNQAEPSPHRAIL